MDPVANIGSLRSSDVQRDGQAVAPEGDLVKRCDRSKPIDGTEIPVGVEDLLLVGLAEKGLRLFAGDIVDRVDEENLALVLAGLVARSVTTTASIGLL